MTRLLDREQIAVVDRDLDLVARAVGHLRAQRHRMAGRQQLGCPRSTTCRASGAARPAPVQPNDGDMAPGAPSGDSSRTGGEFLAIVCRSSDQQQIVDLRALEVDRAGERWRSIAHARRSRRARRRRLCSALGAVGAAAAPAAGAPAPACRSRPWCSAGWRSGNICSPPTSSRAARARSAPPRGSYSCCRSLGFDPHQEPGRGLGRPRGGSAGCASAPASRPARRHSVGLR